MASQQVEVYSKVLKTTISKYLEEGIEDMQKNLKDIIVRTLSHCCTVSNSYWIIWVGIVVSQWAHILVFADTAQLYRQQQPQGTHCKKNFTGHRSCSSREVCPAQKSPFSHNFQKILLTSRGYNVTPITLGLNQAAIHAKVYSSLDSMLTKNTLNTSDITNVSMGKPKTIWSAIQIFAF